MTPSYKLAGRQHAGLILVSTKTFRQGRAFPGAITDALAALLSTRAAIGPIVWSSSAADARGRSHA